MKDRTYVRASFYFAWTLFHHRARSTVQYLLNKIVIIYLYWTALYLLLIKNKQTNFHCIIYLRYCYIIIDRVLGNKQKGSVCKHVLNGVLSGFREREIAWDTFLLLLLLFSRCKTSNNLIFWISNDGQYSAQWEIIFHNFRTTAWFFIHWL